MSQLTRCLYCRSWIDTELGSLPPGSADDADGSHGNPRAPGDYDDVCDRCNYGLDLRGGPNADPSLFGSVRREQ